VIFNEETVGGLAKTVFVHFRYSTNVIVLFNCSSL